jgi:DNA-binding FrmR family transcriptional regulator
MATYGYADKKEDIAKRLKRIEGQVRGVGKMIEGDKYCIDILTQITATKAALDKVGLELLREHTRYCLKDPEMYASEEAKIDELITTFGRMLSR